MLDHQIKRTWLVTHYEACDDCLKLTNVEELAKKQRYIYGQGYVRKEHSCQACFDKEVAVKEVLREEERKKWSL